MQIPQITNNPTKVQLARPSYIYVEHPDLDEFANFASDFGFTRIRGGAFVAQSREEFDKAAKIEGARLGSIASAPGGGEIIPFNRPDDTFFHVVYGQKERQLDSQEPSAINEELGPFNMPFTRPRQGEQHGLLGHYVYVFPDFDNELAWYTNNFNFVSSDILHHWDLENVDVMVSLHLDLGAEFSDHHCMFIQRAKPHVKKAFCHHTSFEVADFDTQLIGHQWLAFKKWHSVWGVGRHVLGSQIFDYWADPSGFKIEHYADGDLVNKDTATTRDVVGPFSVWGPEMPKDFGGEIPEAFYAMNSPDEGLLSRWWH
ncbi:Glyoxalase/Bleomycin resistance protein/Dihydroxybiphenyl dioxygenase [Colletotrichum caudatum]|nr:Glyoxalase/Bleomycin resistance protein/Dihydroxybiphenyl dioxygenase [Colletotrichum caudatum]